MLLHSEVEEGLTRACNVLAYNLNFYNKQKQISLTIYIKQLINGLFVLWCRLDYPTAESINKPTQYHGCWMWFPVSYLKITENMSPPSLWHARYAHCQYWLPIAKTAKTTYKESHCRVYSRYTGSLSLLSFWNQNSLVKSWIICSDLSSDFFNEILKVSKPRS